MHPIHSICAKTSQFPYLYIHSKLKLREKNIYSTLESYYSNNYSIICKMSYYNQGRKQHQYCHVNGIKIDYSIHSAYMNIIIHVFFGTYSTQYMSVLRNDKHECYCQVKGQKSRADRNVRINIYVNSSSHQQHHIHSQECVEKDGKNIRDVQTSYRTTIHKKAWK